MNVEPPPVQIIIDQKQLENAIMFQLFGYHDNNLCNTYT